MRVLGESPCSCIAQKCIAQKCIAQKLPDTYFSLVRAAQNLTLDKQN